ncbi:MAG TPA: tetratricopeptide repeat protein, partial [Solirubrobacteraceae bacterium]|nr:tetratricopeptide repeat protein [Solirubrobacteraceae bacterium]
MSVPPDPPALPEGIAGRVPAGGYALVVGDTAGMAIEPVEGQEVLPSLAEAVAQAPGEPKRLANRAASFGGAIDDVSQAVDKAERALKRAVELMQPRTDPAALSDEIGIVIDLLARLDRDEHWTEALRIARSLAMLLALLGRWLDLLESLQTAFEAAERLGDAGGQAWALHEQGTVHLAVKEHASANRLLTRAHDLREQIGDRRALALTNRNLQVLCQALRAELKHPPDPKGPCERSLLKGTLGKPIAAAALTIAALLLGGVA